MPTAYCPNPKCAVVSMQGVGTSVHGRRTRCMSCGTLTVATKGKRRGGKK
jgi:hypothetical protein